MGLKQSERFKQAQLRVNAKGSSGQSSLEKVHVDLLFSIKTTLIAFHWRRVIYPLNIASLLSITLRNSNLNPFTRRSAVQYGELITVPAGLLQIMAIVRLALPHESYYNNLKVFGICVLM